MRSDDAHDTSGTRVHAHEGNRRRADHAVTLTQRTLTFGSSLEFYFSLYILSLGYPDTETEDG
jgi:hypothetical protein